ncbi:hypothetical protein AEA09_09840 [Lysinibacillus contaminans]|uniref:Uncharacterized protein n=1 Tax=Lysinibacillus contaminans TaxID=1293441 RepID=A0ABR5K1L0_9BACI|nr:hypothetical protein [Lysinibacillus contaminans]KOS68810.1 hypothetical protein AEA09_09840 [Lysinibacillus contaminans]
MLEEILSAFIPMGDKALDTKKIDKNIKILQSEKWFQELYSQEQYRRLFIMNRKIRTYLESNKRTQTLIREVEKQKKFIILLHEQIK